MLKTTTISANIEIHSATLFTVMLLRCIQILFLGLEKSGSMLVLNQCKYNKKQNRREQRRLMDFLPFRFDLKLRSVRHLSVGIPSTQRISSFIHDNPNKNMMRADGKLRAANFVSELQENLLPLMESFSTHTRVVWVNHGQNYVLPVTIFSWTS